MPTDIIKGLGAKDRVKCAIAAWGFSTVNDAVIISTRCTRRKALIYVSDGYDFNPFQTRASLE